MIETLNKDLNNLNKIYKHLFNIILLKCGLKEKKLMKLYLIQMIFLLYIVKITFNLLLFLIKCNYLVLEKEINILNYNKEIIQFGIKSQIIMILIKVNSKIYMDINLYY